MTVPLLRYPFFLSRDSILEKLGLACSLARAIGRIESTKGFGLATAQIVPLAENFAQRANNSTRLDTGKAIYSSFLAK
jgi:hypothetical protein